MTHLQACSSGFPESRYVVIKESDLYEAGRVGLLTVAQLAALVKIKAATQEVRRVHCKPLLEILVIEKDWPEYEATFELLAARVLEELRATENA